MADVLAKMSAVTTFANAVVSVVLVGFLYNAARPALIKMQLFAHYAEAGIGKEKIRGVVVKQLLFFAGNLNASVLECILKCRKHRTKQLKTRKESECEEHGIS